MKVKLPVSMAERGRLQAIAAQRCFVICAQTSS
jgi:hypothetical protein